MQSAVGRIDHLGELDSQFSGSQKVAFLRAKRFERQRHATIRHDRNRLFDDVRSIAHCLVVTNARQQVPLHG